MLHLEFAAHVGHPVTHTSKAARIGLGVVGAVIAVAACSTGVGTVAVISAGVTGANRGWDIGELIDNYVLPPSIQGYILTGLASVLLGRQCKQAARAHTDTIAGCDSDPVAEGSNVVMLGREFKPMSRRQDRVECGGTIADGNRTIVVGGTPSKKGQEWDEKDSAFVKGVTVLFAINDLYKALPVGKPKDWLGAGSTVAGTAANLADQKDLETLIKSPAALGKLPESAASLEGLDYGQSTRKLGETGVNLSTKYLGK